MSVIKVPDILLPEAADMSFWAVNACDQYTSDSDYWQKVEELTKGRDSTFNLIFPEIYLKDEPEKRIARINRNMRDYLSGGVFKEVKGGFVLVERTTPAGTRTGVVLSVDLEEYSFRPEDKAKIRSTEATILERIPPRAAIRKNAEIELPHVMLLFNDPKNSVLKSVKRGKTLYDFDLMMNGGHIKGTFIENAEELIKAFYALAKGEEMLFAVGDGNHSLATAKACWEELKPSLSYEERKNHPARFALVEVVNIYDKALQFKPIHRLVKTDRIAEFINGYKPNGEKSAYTVVEGKKQKVAFNADIPTGIRLLDAYISEFIKKYGGEVDYIHGEEELAALTKVGGVGIELPPIQKSDFFKLINDGGNLPKKTFSMGEGDEKRYYVEAKRIKRA